MFVSAIAIAGGGVCAGVLGGLAGRSLFARLTNSAALDQSLVARGCWKRSLATGLLANGVLGLAFTVDDVGQVHRLAALACLVVSFVLAGLHAIAWLKLMTTFGPGAIESGELSLVVTVTLAVLLHVCGILWMTLVILGGCVLAAITVLNGLWFYRLR